MKSTTLDDEVNASRHRASNTAVHMYILFILALDVGTTVSRTSTAFCRTYIRMARLLSYQASLRHHRIDSAGGESVGQI